MVFATYLLSGVRIWDWLALVFVFLLGILMVSEVHYPDNKGASADRLHLKALLISLAVMVVCIILAWTTWAAAICAGYILFGMINTYMNRKRKSRRIIRRRKRSIEVHEEE